MTPTKPPPELDYETWIGPVANGCLTSSGRVHMNWRWNYNTGGGQLLDWIGHHCDIAHWGMDATGAAHPKSKVRENFRLGDEVWNTCTKYKIELQVSPRYHDDDRRRISGNQAGRNG